MTAKRFTHKKWLDDRQLFDGDEPFAIVDVYIQAEEICNKLNELYEENKEFKAKLDDKEVVVEVECEKLMQKVFDLIDKSLEKDKQYYKMTYEDYLNGRIEALEELKKEMME